MEKSVLSREKHDWNKNHGWKKVPLIKKTIAGMISMGEKVSNNVKQGRNNRHGWEKLLE